jgi:hypothetical protein
MRYDVTLKLKNHRGQPLPTGQDEDGKPIGEATLRDVLETLCLANTEATKSGEQKLRVYRILQRTTAAAPELELDDRDLTAIKAIAELAYPPSVYGMLVDVLEAPAAKPADAPSRG